MYEIPVYKISMVRDGQQRASVNRVNSPVDATKLLENYFAGADREHFVVVLLNTKYDVIGINTVSIGNLNSSIVHPREVFKPAVVANAAAIIVCHNHPSGDPTPSVEDKVVTKRLVEAGKIMGIDVIDHIVIGDGKHFSFKEKLLI